MSGEPACFGAWSQASTPRRKQSRTGAADGTRLGDDVAADISVVNLLAQVLGHKPPLLRVNSLTLALLMGNILEGIRCYRK